MASVWDNLEEVQPTNDIWADVEEVKTQPVKQPVKQTRTYPNQPVKNMTEEEFKQNVDKLYDIPQVDIPQRGVLVNSNGEVKKGQNINKNLTPEKQAEIARIKAEFEARNKEIDREHRKQMAKLYGGALLEIGSAAIPVGAGLRLGGLALKAGKPIAQQVIKNLATRGAIEGGLSGLIGGVGRGMVEDKDLKGIGQTALTDAGIGLVGGAGLGAIGGKIATNVGKTGQRIKNIEAKQLAKKQPQATKEVKAEVVEQPQQLSLDFNRVDDVIPEQVVEATQTGKMKQSALAQKANKSDEVAQAVQENPPLYEAITNADTTAQAQLEIAQNADRVHTDIVKKLVDGDKDFSALDVEKTRQLFSELQKQGRFDEATELLELTSKQGSKLGQAVQAFSLWSKTTPDGAMLYAQKLLDKYNKGVRKDLQKRLSEEELRDIGETFQKLNESGLTGRELEVETAKAMKKVFKVVPKTFAQKLDGYRYINMLLSPQSRIKDFILTAKNASDTAIDESIAGGIDYLRTLGSKDKTRYISANPFAGTKAWLQGAKKGFKEGVEDVRYGINTSRSGEVGRYGLPNTPTFKEANFEGGLLDRAKTLIGNPIGSAEKLLRYTLQVPDRMFFEARYASSLANQMKARGVTEPTQDMINRAVEEAKRAVFQEDRLVTKKLAEAAQLPDVPIHALENAIGLPQGTLPSTSKGLAPFVKTPTNVTAQGAEGLHGLGSGLLQLKNASDNPELIREAELLMGRGVRGLGELGLGVAVGKGLWDKIKTNIGEEDYYKNEITGLQPSSLVIGDKAISLQNMQNNLPFFTGVGLGQRGLGKAFTNTTDIIAEMPALKALGDLYNINKEANYIAQSDEPDKELLKKGSRAARSLGANYLTTLIPVGGWLGELRNDIDPYARELYTPDRYDEGVLQGLGSDAEYLKNRVQNRIPGLSTLLPNRYNSLGQPIMSNNIQNPVARTLSQAVNFGIRNYNEPPAEMEEMQRIQDYAMENDITGKTTLKFAKPKRYIGRGKDKTRLTNEQYSELTRLYNGKVYDELLFLMNTPEYQSADEKTQIKWVREVMKEKKQEAEQEISDIIK